MCKGEYSTGRTGASDVNGRTATATKVETRAMSAVRRINVMFRAFADPTRLRILHLVQDSRRCASATS